METNATLLLRAFLRRPVVVGVLIVFAVVFAVAVVVVVVVSSHFTTVYRQPNLTDQGAKEGCPHSAAYFRATDQVKSSRLHTQELRKYN